MSQFIIYIPLDPYLAQWFIHESGGETPVTLPKGSIESKILEIFLTKRPENVKPDRGGVGMVPIYIPTFRNRPPEYYNYLPHNAKSALVESIRNRFDVQMWSDLHCFGSICCNKQSELIYAFMEKHGIEQDERNWKAIAKRYQRLRKIYYNREQRKNRKK